MWILVKISKADWSVRTAVAATCIKILSQVTRRNENLIACSLLLSVISFGIIFTCTKQPCLK